MKDYILEIKSSENIYPDILQLKGNDLILKMDKGDKEDINEEQVRRPNESNYNKGFEKYIKFTIRQGQDNDGFNFTTLVKIVIMMTFIYIIFHHLNKVNPIGKIFKIKFQLNSIYLVLSINIVNLMYWQIDHKIEESLIIIPNFGIQMESLLIKKNIIYLIMVFLTNNRIRIFGKDNLARRIINDKGDKIIMNRQFIPIEYIKDMIINEGFLDFKVIFYLSLIMKEGVASEDKTKGVSTKLKMVVLFPKLLPRRALLETVYRRSRKFL